MFKINGIPVSIRGTVKPSGNGHFPREEQEKEDKERERLAEIYAKRYASGQDLWSGEDLPDHIDSSK